jgi:hypothetical protein
MSRRYVAASCTMISIDQWSSRRPKFLIRTAIAAAVLSIGPSYVVSAGPAAYFDGRGWVDGDVARTPYLPLLMVSGNRLGETWLDYVNTCYRLGLDHSGG